MKFYNYPDPSVRTTIYQSILNFLHKPKDSQSQNNQNICLELLQEFPFNCFFINLICYVRDSLLLFFQNIENEREGNNALDQKAFELQKECVIDFEGQFESLIYIIKDMASTTSKSFNSFMKGVIL